MTKLKILRIVPFFYPAFGYGGPVIHSYNISKIQAQLGYDVNVFTTNIIKHNLISNTLPRYEIVQGIKIHRFPIRFKIKNSHYWITPSMIPNILKSNSDLIHAHTFRTFQTDIASFLSKIKRKPFIITAHGNMRDLTELAILKGTSSSKLIKIHDKFVKSLCISAADKIIVHSKYEAYWTKRIGINEDKIEVIPHGVDVEKFSDHTLKEKFLNRFQFQGKLILYVGRILRNYRNLHDLIKMMPSIIEEVSDVKLLLIGESFDLDYEMELRKLVSSQNLSNYVHFITNPTWEDIIGGYLSANVFVFPTNRSESFGIPLLEAGAAHCPVVAPKIGPVPELVKNNYSGLLTKPADQNDLKKKVLRILTDNKLERTLGDNGYKRISSAYTWKVVAESINNLYSELI